MYEVQGIFYTSIFLAENHLNSNMVLKHILDLWESLVSDI